MGGAKDAWSYSALDAVVAEAAVRSLPIDEVGDMRVVAGQGVVGSLHRREIHVGSRRMFADAALVPAVEDALQAIEQSGGTAVIVSERDSVAGVIGFVDEPRPGAAGAVAALHRSGVRDVVMLTGDHALAAERIARATGVDDVRAGLLPQDKLDQVRALRAEGRVMAMVGNGINDALSLAAADVGIAMGVVGTDAAIETADIALMGDDLSGVSQAIRPGKRARRTIGTNVAFSIGVKVLTLGLAVAGFSTL